MFIKTRPLVFARKLAGLIGHLYQHTVLEHIVMIKRSNRKQYFKLWGASSSLDLYSQLATNIFIIVNDLNYAASAGQLHLFHFCGSYLGTFGWFQRPCRYAGASWGANRDLSVQKSNKHIIFLVCYPFITKYFGTKHYNCIHISLVVKTFVRKYYWDKA